MLNNNAINRSSPLFPRTPVVDPNALDARVAFQAEAAVQVSQKAGANVWSIGGRDIPTGSIQAIGPARGGLDIPTEVPSRFTVFVVPPTDRPGLPASTDPTTGDRRRYGVLRGAEGAVLVDLNRVDARGQSAAGAFRLPVSQIINITRAVAGVDYPQAIIGPNGQRPDIDTKFAVAVTKDSRVRL